MLVASKNNPETFSGWELRKIGGRRSDGVRMEVVFHCETNGLFCWKSSPKDDDGMMMG